MEQNLGNININGIGSTNGGQFNQVEINGIGTVQTDVQAETILIDGKGKFQGTTTANTLEINGVATFQNNVQAKKLEISGKVTIQGDTKAETINNQGSMKVSGNCESETLHAEGQVQIGGQLNAETITMTAWKSKIEEIVGSNIKINQYPTFLSKIVNSFTPVTNIINTIEGDNIEIGYTTAKIVRGENIIIGADCQIDLVEYSGSFQQHSTANVKEARQI